MTAADWNPTLYHRFAAERVRPVYDLLARVPLERADAVVDLGCGSGLSTAPLVERFGAAAVTGLDSSPAMLAEAARAVPGVHYLQADVSAWSPEAPVDLLFSNALLQWVPDHARLLPRLMGLLRPGGVLAYQVPVNLAEPSHRLMGETAAASPFAAIQAGAAGAREALPTLRETYALIAPHATRLEMWETTYVHVLAGVDAIVEMVRSTGLRPWLAPLDAAQTEAYLTRYRAALAEAYPTQADGRVLYRFPRRFVVAVR